jgi:hypothetical protein
MAHELGHACGLLHAPCGTLEYVDPDYPSYSTIGNPVKKPDASIGEFGVRLDCGLWPPIAIFSPSTKDFMSYCEKGHNWISLYHYRKLLDSDRLPPERFNRWPHLPEEFNRPPYQEDPWVVNLEPVISIIGIVHSESELEVASVVRLQTRTQLAGGKDTGFVAELIGAQGQVLSDAAVFIFQPPVRSGCGCGCPGCKEKIEYPVLFQAYIPNVERGMALRIRRGGEAAWSCLAPASATCISEWSARLITDDPEGCVHSQVALEWCAESSGEQPIEAWMQWSGDCGKNWHAFATGLKEQKAMLDASILPSGLVHLRLMVDDGFDTAESPPIMIEIPHREPTVTIFTPREGQTLFAGLPMRLWAVSTADDGSTPTNENVEWLLEEKNIGAGLDVFTTAPPPGQYCATIIVSVNGHRTKRSVKFKTIYAT